MLLVESRLISGQDKQPLKLSFSLLEVTGNNEMMALKCWCKSISWLDCAAENVSQLPVIKIMWHTAGARISDLKTISALAVDRYIMDADCLRGLYSLTEKKYMTGQIMMIWMASKGFLMHIQDEVLQGFLCFINDS